MKVTRVPADPADLEQALLDAPVRYVYLLEHWPDTATVEPQHLQQTAQQTAPADAIVRALTKEVTVLTEVLSRERYGRRKAESAVTHLEQAARQLLDAVPVATTLFDEPGEGE